MLTFDRKVLETPFSYQKNLNKNSRIIPKGTATSGIVLRRGDGESTSGKEKPRVRTHSSLDGFIEIYFFHANFHTIWKL